MSDTQQPEPADEQDRPPDEEGADEGDGHLPLTRRDLMKVGSGTLAGLVFGSAATGSAAAADTSVGQIGEPGSSVDIYVDQLRDEGGDVVLDVDDTGPMSANSRGVVDLDQLRLADSSSDPTSNGEARRNGADLKVYSGGAVRNLTNIGGGGGGSAITAQEDDTDLTTDMALVDFKSGLTATNPSGDEVDVVTDESEIDHDSLSNFVSNEHVDHSSVSVSGGSGLSGGGDLTASRTLAVDLDIDDSGADVGTGHNLNFTNNLTVTDQGGGQLDISASTGAGSAIEAQEDGGQLSTDTTLINWQSGLTATNPSGDNINVNVDESEFSLSASNISDVSADSVSGAHHSKYTDSDAESAINSDGDHGSTASHNYTSSASGLSDVSADSVSGAHHSKTTSASELTDVSADSVSGAHHSKTTQAKAGTALSKAGDTLNVSGVSGTEINLSDIAGNNITVDGVNDELDASASGSAITAQEDGSQLSTDTSLINWQSGLTATNPSGDNINVNVDESEVDHDSLQNFVGTEHVDHDTVTITTSSPLSGGGDLTASRTIGITIGNGLEDNAGSLRVNPAGVAGDGLKETSATAMGVEPADFAGAGLKDDGSDNLETQDVRVVSSSLNAQDIDTILMDASGGARSVQLPTPSSDINVTVKKIDSSGNAVNITTPGAETIDGQSSIGITSQYTSRTIVSDGSDYYIT